MMFKTENPKIHSLLLEKAKESVFANHKHATCICHRGRVLACETNQRKTHTLQKRFSGKETKCWLHSEIATIIRVINLYGAEILKDCELFNLRLTGGGNIGCAKPCISCSRAIEAFGITRVFHT